MQRINIHIQDIAVFINDPYRFLQFSIGFYFLQAAVHAHAMINMCYIISRLQLAQGLNVSALFLL